MQRDKGKCPKPCGKWEVEVDEANAGPLSLSMKQRHRRAPIVLPALSDDEPPPYDLTNAPPLYGEATDDKQTESVNPMTEEEQDRAAEECGLEQSNIDEDQDVPELDGLDKMYY